jgi:AcrR family transcriptional regulator
VTETGGDSLAVQAGRREERKAQNRAKLLAAARTVFAEKGVGEATARDIVRATDLATGTFYNYFRDKEEVFQALLREFEDKVRDATMLIRRDTSLPFEERLELGARAFFRVVIEDAELFCVFRRNAGAIAMVPAGTLFGAGMEELEEDLELWRSEGNLLPGVDPDYLGALIAGSAMQVANTLLERDPPDPDEAARFLTRAILGAIAAVAADPSAAG